MLVLETCDDFADAVHHLVTKAAGHPAPKEALQSGENSNVDVPAVHLIPAAGLYIQMACTTAAGQVMTGAGPGAQKVVLSPTTCLAWEGALHTKPAVILNMHQCCH